jgi:hypothetical protein
MYSVSRIDAVIKGERAIHLARTRKYGEGKLDSAGDRFLTRVLHNSNPGAGMRNWFGIISAIRMREISAWIKSIAGNGLPPEGWRNPIGYARATQYKSL